MRTVGRGLQAFALVLLLVGLIFGMERGPDAMRFEIGCLVGGVCIFLLGLQVQKWAGKEG